MALYSLAERSEAIAALIYEHQPKTIVSHLGCSDGIASAMILKNFYDRDMNVKFVAYGTKEHEELKAEPGLLFCDMTPPRSRYQEFVDVGAFVLDHHKGAEDMVADFGDHGLFADERNEPGVSGAVLAAGVSLAMSRLKGFVHPQAEAVINFAHLVGVRDTWQKNNHDWVEANQLCSAIIFYGWENLQEQAYLSTQQFDVGRILYDQRLRKAKKIAEKGCIKLNGWLIFNDGERLISDVAEQARSYYAEGSGYGVCGFYYVVDDGIPKLIASLRSLEPEVNCAEIAKQYGGGGHTAAAGFTTYEPVDNPFMYLADLLA